MQYTCAACGKVFEKTGNPAKYCSPACKQSKQNNKVRTTQCVVCGEMVSFKGYHPSKFCSRACIAKARQILKDDPNDEIIKKLGWKPVERKVHTRVCIVCGKYFETKSSLETNRRCPTCLDEYRKNFYKGAQNIPARVVDAIVAEEGLEFEVGEANRRQSESQNPTALQTREELNSRANRRRRELRAKRNAIAKKYVSSKKVYYRKQLIDNTEHPQCVACGYDQFKDALIVHHLDMNRGNNDPDNLVVLCCNCHQVLHMRLKPRLLKLEDNTSDNILKECMDSYNYVVQQGRSKTGAYDGDLF